MKKYFFIAIAMLATTWATWTYSTSRNVHSIQTDGNGGLVFNIRGAESERVGSGYLKGTSTNDDAPTGYIGEYIESSNVLAGTWPGASNTTTEVTSITLTPGDWDLSFIWRAYGGSGVTGSGTWISTASASTAGRVLGSNYMAQSASELHYGLPVYRVKVATTTTYYMNSSVTFSTTGPSYAYRFSARRMR